MLKSLLVGYLSAHWQSSLVAALLFDAAAFMWDLYTIDDGGATLKRKSPTQMGVYWALLVAGGLLAILERLLLTRSRRTPLRMSFFREETLREVLMAALFFFALFWYDIDVDDPAASVFGSFASGAVLSIAFVWLVALIIELVDIWSGLTTTGRAFDWLGTNLFGAIVLSIMAAFDVAIFRDGWLLVLVTIGTLALVRWAGMASAMLLHTRLHTA